MRAAAVIAGLFTVLCLALVTIIAVAIGVGSVIHSRFPAIDLGMAAIISRTPMSLPIV